MADKLTDEERYARDRADSIARNIEINRLQFLKGSEMAKGLEFAARRLGFSVEDAKRLKEEIDGNLAIIYSIKRLDKNYVEQRTRTEGSKTTVNDPGISPFSAGYGLSRADLQNLPDPEKQQAAADEIEKLFGAVSFLIDTQNKHGGRLLEYEGSLDSLSVGAGDAMSVLKGTLEERKAILDAMGFKDHFGEEEEELSVLSLAQKLADAGEAIYDSQEVLNLPTDKVEVVAATIEKWGRENKLLGDDMVGLIDSVLDYGANMGELGESLAYLEDDVLRAGLDLRMMDKETQEQADAIEKAKIDLDRVRIGIISMVRAVRNAVGALGGLYSAIREQESVNLRSGLDERADALESFVKEFLLDFDERRENETAEANEFYDEQLRLEKRRFFEGLISREEFERSAAQAHKALEQLDANFEEARINKIEEFEEEKQALDEETNNKVLAFKRETAATQKAFGITSILLDTIIGVASALANPFPINLVLAALVAAAGGIAVATLAATPLPSFQYGGIFEVKKALTNPSAPLDMPAEDDEYDIYIGDDLVGTGNFNNDELEFA